MTWSDISDIFAEIEVLLIGSLHRNLKAHEEWEKEEGFTWPAWQSLKLENIENFRRENRELMNRYKKVIGPETEKLLKEQFAEGKGETQDGVTETSFFGINRRRNEALISDILNLEENAQSAALRMMDDVYRQTVYKAHLAMSSGAVTLPQAIDMATKSFLEKGIDCIVYKDGSRHNIADYVQMALRTAATRSYLQGEAEKRMELGIDTVIVSQYGACSETCLPWQGKVYIDDVFMPFSGEQIGNKGKSVNGKWYTLLSVAVKARLFHPNCRHTLSTWDEGISSLPEPLDKNKIRENSKLEAKQRELEREVRKWKRLAEGTQEEWQRKTYQKKVREAQKNLREFIAEHEDVLRRDYWRESTHGVSVDNSRKDDIIKAEHEQAGMDIEVDALTPCLIDNATGNIVPTVFSKADPEDLRSTRKSGWLFDWDSEELSGEEIYKLSVKGKTDIEGLIALKYEERSKAVYAHIAESAPHNRGKGKKYSGIGGHLFAIAACKSKEKGYGGFVYMDAKNEDLIEHYKKQLGALLLGMPHPYRMIIDEEGAEMLLEKYTFDEE